MLEQAQVPGLSSTHTNPLMSQPEVNFNVRKLVFWGGGGGAGVLFVNHGGYQHKTKFN